MAQRRSKNRRLSETRRSNNLSGFLDENTNVVGENDQLWFNRTSVRPSTSLILTQNDSSILSSNTTINTHQVSEKWYNNLSKSDTSKFFETAAQKNIVQQFNEAKDQTVPTESESDQEPQKRRARFRPNKRSHDKSDKSNIFTKALDKTAESHAQNLSRHILEGNASESTNEDSRTIQRLRPKIFRTNKQTAYETNEFEDAFQSKSATEKIHYNINSPRVPLSRINKQLSSSEVVEELAISQKPILSRRNNATENILTLEPTKQKRQLRSENKVVDDVLSSASNSLQNQSSPTSTKALTKSHRSSQNKSKIKSKQDGTDESNNLNNSSVTEKIIKKRHIMFSQDLKSRSDSNLFDAVFDSDDSLEKNSQNTLTIKKKNEKKLESVEKRHDSNYTTSESLSISKNIGRTRSFSTFAHKQLASQIYEEESGAKSEELKMVGNKKSNRHSNNITMSLQSSTNNSTVGEQNVNVFNATEKIPQINDKKSSHNFEIFNVPKSQAIIEETDGEEIYEKSNYFIKESEHDDKKFQNHYNQKQVDSVRKTSFNDSTLEKRKISHRSMISQSKSNNSNDDINEKDSLISMANKNRSHSLKKKSRAESVNVFDQISYKPIEEHEKSDANVENTSRVSQQNKSDEPSKRNSLANSSKSSNTTLYHDDHKDVNNSQQGENDAETSLISNYNGKTSSRSFQRSKEAIVLDAKGSIFASSSRSKEQIQDVSLAAKTDISLKRKSLSKSFSEKNALLKDNSKKRSAITQNNDKSSENSEQARLIDRTPKSKTNQSTTTPLTSCDGASDFNSDGLLSPSHPAQSTLNPYGKPLTRITQFSFRHSIIPETPVSVAASYLLGRDVKEREEIAVGAAENNVNVVEDDGQDSEVDVINNSDSNYCPLISRHVQDAPCESDDEDSMTYISPKAKPSTSSVMNQSSASIIDVAVWASIRKKTDAVKDQLEARAKRAEQEERERVKLKSLVDAKLKRRIIQQEAKKRYLQRKPLDKAYQVNGKPYKQPKLPRPKKWVTPRLYKYLRKCLEPHFGLETRIRSEQFVKKLTDVFNIVVKRKKYENYKADLVNLMQTMAELKIVENRYDFWRFCCDFMPPNFKDKVVPMQKPGNVRNIPYEPELVYKPILTKRKLRRKSKSSSESDSN